ncbi:MAG: hypothetical protein EP343_15775 [Deltaproteobacteria bacterium]|nr:MAG: hypothetical protein EP343_15775 [Deltaproteobacteria bacterium]
MNKVWILLVVSFFASVCLLGCGEIPPPSGHAGYKVDVVGQSKSLALTSAEMTTVERALVQLLSRTAVDLSDRINSSRIQPRPAVWPLPEGTPHVFVRYSQPKQVKTMYERESLWAKEIVFAAHHGLFVVDQDNNVHLYTKYQPADYAGFLLSTQSPVRRVEPFTEMAERFRAPWNRFYLAKNR